MSKYEIYYHPFEFCLLGVILFFFYMVRVIKRRRIVKYAKEATGVVIEEVLEIDEDGKKIYYPIVRFSTEENVLYQEKYGDGYYPSRYKDLQEIIIQYSSINPKEFFIKGEKAYRLEILILILGIMSIGYSCYLLYNINFC